jgi:hypothetical protein
VKISTAYIANLVSSHLFFCFSGEKNIWDSLNPASPCWSTWEPRLLTHLW